MPTQQFKVHKNIGIPSLRVMFRVHHIQRHGVGPFHDGTSQQNLSNSTSSDPKEDCMQTIRPWEVDIPTYQFDVHKTICGSSSRFIIMVNIYKGMGYPLISMVPLIKTFPTVSRATQKEIRCKSYALGMLTYQLTTSEFTKLLVFHIIVQFLGYTIDEGMCSNFSLFQSSTIPFQWSLKQPKLRLYENVMPLRS